MQYHLRQVGEFLDLNFMNKPEVMIGGVGTRLTDGKISDDSTLEFLHRHAEAFGNFVAFQKR